MNNERRHELQQNDLAIYLAKLNTAVEPYSRVILVVVAALIFGAIGMSFYSSQQLADKSEATLYLIQASAGGDAEVLGEQISDKYPNTAAAAWARLYQGDQYLAEGSQQLFNDRSKGTELLSDADAAFRNAIGNSNDPLLRSRAHYGIARAAEALGNVEDAVAAYTDVIADAESDAMVKQAEERIAALNKPQTKEFLVWFADQDFSPADPSLPPSLPGSEALPALPDLELPGLDFGDAEEKKDFTDAIEMPADADPTDEAKTDEPAAEAADTESNEPAAAEATPEPAKAEEAEAESEQGSDE